MLCAADPTHWCDSTRIRRWATTGWHATARPTLLFTDNETNTERLWGVPNRSRYVKDGIDSALIVTAAATP